MPQHHTHHTTHHTPHTAHHTQQAHHTPRKHRLGDFGGDRAHTRVRWLRKKEPTSFADQFEFIPSVTLGSNIVRQKESCGSAKKRAEVAQRYGTGLHWSNVTSKGEWGIDHSCGDRSALFFAVPGMEVYFFCFSGSKTFGVRSVVSAQGSVRQVHIFSLQWCHTSTMKSSVLCLPATCHSELSGSDEDTPV